MKDYWFWKITKIWKEFLSNDIKIKQLRVLKKIQVLFFSKFEVNTPNKKIFNKIIKSFENVEKGFDSLGYVLDFFEWKNISSRFINKFLWLLNDYWALKYLDYNDILIQNIVLEMFDFFLQSKNIDIDSVVSEDLKKQFIQWLNQKNKKFNWQKPIEILRKLDPSVKLDSFEIEKKVLSTKSKS